MLTCSCAGKFAAEGLGASFQAFPSIRLAERSSTLHCSDGRQAADAQPGRSEKRHWGYTLDIRLDGNGQLPRARDRLDDNVALLDAAAQQLVLGALEQRLDDGRVPAGVDDADAQGAAVVLLRGRAFEGGSHCVVWWGWVAVGERCVTSVRACAFSSESDLSSKKSVRVGRVQVICLPAEVIMTRISGQQQLPLPKLFVSEARCGTNVPKLGVGRGSFMLGVIRPLSFANWSQNDEGLKVLCNVR